MSNNFKNSSIIIVFHFQFYWKHEFDKNLMSLAKIEALCKTYVFYVSRFHHPQNRRLIVAFLDIIVDQTNISKSKCQKLKIPLVFASKIKACNNALAVITLKNIEFMCRNQQSCDLWWVDLWLQGKTLLCNVYLFSTYH